MAAAERAPTPQEAIAFEWADAAEFGTGAVGWVVFDRVINGVTGGGVSMHAAATQAEVAAVARNMSHTFTVCDTQIGGAHAGIRFDHRSREARAVLRRFLAAHKTLLQSVWVTAADLNTDAAFVESVIRELGLPAGQFALGKAIARVTGSRNRSADLAAAVLLPVNEHLCAIEAAAGFGVAESVRFLRDKFFRPRRSGPAERDAPGLKDHCSTAHDLAPSRGRDRAVACALCGLVACSGCCGRGALPGVFGRGGGSAPAETKAGTTAPPAPACSLCGVAACSGGCG
jgi:hypothetical protein